MDGWSVATGRDTLVVDCTSFNDQTWFDRLEFHSDALHVVERYTPISLTPHLRSHHSRTQRCFHRPWKMSMPLYRRLEKDASIVGIHVCGVRRRAYVWTSSQAAEQVRRRFEMSHRFLASMGAVAVVDRSRVAGAGTRRGQAQSAVRRRPQRRLGLCHVHRWPPDLQGVWTTAPSPH